MTACDVSSTAREDKGRAEGEQAGASLLARDTCLASLTPLSCTLSSPSRSPHRDTGATSQTLSSMLTLSSGVQVQHEDSVSRALPALAPPHLACMTRSTSPPSAACLPPSSVRSRLPQCTQTQAQHAQHSQEHTWLSAAIALPAGNNKSRMLIRNGQAVYYPKADDAAGMQSSRGSSSEGFSQRDEGCEAQRTDTEMTADAAEMAGTVAGDEVTAKSGMPQTVTSVLVSEIAGSDVGMEVNRDEADRFSARHNPCAGAEGDPDDGGHVQHGGGGQGDEGGRLGLHEGEPKGKEAGTLFCWDGGGAGGRKLDFETPDVESSRLLSDAAVVLVRVEDAGSAASGSDSHAVKRGEREGEREEEDIGMAGERGVEREQESVSRQSELQHLRRAEEESAQEGLELMRREREQSERERRQRECEMAWEREWRARQALARAASKTEEQDLEIDLELTVFCAQAFACVTAAR